MFGRRITLFRLFGFAVRVDISWLVVAVLITWSLAVGAFPEWIPGLSVRTYWIMGAAGALALFLSIVVHEFSHAMVARAFGMQMRGITLFIFGGVAEMEEEPETPKAEFLMAIAGPLASVGIAIVFAVLWFGGRMGGWRMEITGVFGYLAFVNVLLVVFNMIPAFPLDGGRVLRSMLWAWKDNLRWATRIASQAGSIFGLILVALGLVSFLFGSFIQGVWWFLIGLFLRNMASASYQQVLVKQTLQGEPVSRFMKTDPLTVPRSISIRELVEDYIYRYHFKMFPVVDDGRLTGCITTRQVKELPREEWDRQTVGAYATACTAANTVPPDADAMQALARMNSSGLSRLIVAEGDRLYGVVSLKDMLRFLSLKIELEEKE